ncbi:hypothetical protein JCM16418A_07490 [Paenibacillus pini]
MASQGCLPEFVTSEFHGQTKERMRRSRKTVLLRWFVLLLITIIACFSVGLYN